VPGHTAFPEVAARRVDRCPCDQAAREREAGIDPQTKVLLADSVGLAMLVVLETLTPAERIAFVLHNMFDVSFDESEIHVDWPDLPRTTR
jgi:hypothetical protein